MQVPKTVQGVALMCFAVTYPLFIHLIHFIMRNTNGQDVCSNGNSANTPVDARQVSGNSKSLSPAQVEFLSVVMFHGVHDLSASLKLVHESLWEALEKMGKGG